MQTFGECPIGFEDGEIIKYKVQSDRMALHYKFWNEKVGVFEFTGVLGLQDTAAIGTIVGAVEVLNDSPLIQLILKRQYEVIPQSIGVKEFRILDLDDQPILQIVAEECTFARFDE